MSRPTLLAAALFLLLVWSTAPRTAGQGHPHGRMDLDCTLCHDESSWEVPQHPQRFDHGQTGFPLTGGHAWAGCRDCHGELVFAHVGSQCADCHTDIHLGRLGPACGDCHGTDDWLDRDRMRREHDATAFPLVGVHERVDCEVCHTGSLAGQFVGTPTDCYFCHAAEYDQTVDPDHAALGFDQDCRTCHGVFATNWEAGHPGSFPLTGQHALLDCVACHADGYVDTPVDCYSCHVDDFNEGHDPGDPTDCARCHTTASWEGGDD